MLISESCYKTSLRNVDFCDIFLRNYVEIDVLEGLKVNR